MQGKNTWLIWAGVLILVVIFFLMKGKCTVPKSPPSTVYEDYTPPSCSLKGCSIPQSGSCSSVLPGAQRDASSSQCDDGACQCWINTSYKCTPGYKKGYCATDADCQKTCGRVNACSATGKSPC